MSMYLCIAVLLTISGRSKSDEITQTLPHSSCNTKNQSEISFNECLRIHLERYIQNSGNGVQKDEHASLEPLVVNTINMGHNTIKMQLKGMNNTKVEAFMMDTQKCKIYAETVTPFLTSEGEFKSPIATYVVPINDGKTKNETIEDIKVVHIVECEKYKKEGREYLRITKYNVLMKPDTALVKLNRLLEGQSETTKKDYILVKKPKNLKENGVVEKKVGMILSSISNQRLENIPIELLYN